MDKNRVNVVLLKKVGDIEFGMKRSEVRSILGKYKEFSKTKDSKNTADDFKYCHVFYDSNNKCEAVELFDECNVYISGSKIFPSTVAAVRKAVDGLNESNINTEKSVGLTIDGDKVKSILFGKKDYYASEDSSNDKSKTESKKESKVTPKNEADESRLAQFYDDLKSKLDNDTPMKNPNMVKVGGPGAGLNHPFALMYRSKADQEKNTLMDNCCKHLLVDIYCKIIPLDSDYVCGHQGQMKQDVDSMLANKGVSATQYITSAYESTKSPLLEFVLRSVNNIGKLFMEEATEKMKDAQENDIEAPVPEAPSIEDDNVEGQLVDIKSDTEYEDFVGKLKEKTVNKIVSDITKIINNKKDENSMTFNPKPIAEVEAATESTTSVALDYLQKQLITEGVEIDADLQEEMIGMAIRESTLHQFDVVFNRPYSEFKDFASRIRFGKGVLINESAASYFIENGQRYEPLYKETDGGKYDVANYEKIDKDGKKTPMSDDEAKKVLDPDGYKNYQNRDKNKQV